MRSDHGRFLPAVIEAGPTALLAACADSEPPIQRELFAAIARERPDAVLFAGDAAYSGASDRARRSALRRWRRDWGALAERVYAVPGNHDFESPRSLATWQEEMAYPAGAPPGEEGLVFAVEVGPVCAVGVTSADRAVPEAQMAWAVARLSATAAPHRVAVVHEPAWPCGQREGDSLDRRPQERDRLWAAFEDAGVSLVLCGHEHGYSRRRVDLRRPVTQVVTAGAGARLYLTDNGTADVMAPAFHHLRIDANPEVMRCSARALDGRLLDEFELTPAA